MWQALYQAFNNFWNPTPELQAAMKLPTFGARFKAAWKASWRWPVIWRRLVVIFVAVQLWNVGYLAVRGFEKETGGVVRAETPEFPYRTAGPYRTAFVDSASRACIRDSRNNHQNDSLSDDRIFQLCTCTAETIATNMTAKDLQEIAQGGLHVTPRYRELEDQAQTACEKVFTGQ
jgi:hypothetical protein